MTKVNKCKRCALHRYRRQEVPGRGDVPADILFVGEAPGKSEDLRGEPFVGPSGKLLALAMDAARKMAGLEKLPTYHIANVVRCRPTDSKGGSNREPTAQEAWACWPFLKKVLAEVKPKQVIFLGKIPEKYCKAAMPGGIYLYHPAYILRNGGERSSQWREFVRRLSEIFTEIVECRKSKSEGRRSRRRKLDRVGVKKRVVRRREGKSPLGDPERNLSVSSSLQRIKRRPTRRRRTE